MLNRVIPVCAPLVKTGSACQRSLKSTDSKPGFNAVEFPFPYSVPAPEYLRMQAENGLVQVSIGAPTSDYKSGMPGCSIFDGVPLAAELGLRQTNAVD